MELNDKPKVAIIYYSQTGTTHGLAEAVAQGAEEAGAEVRLLRARELADAETISQNEAWANHLTEVRHLPDATTDDMLWADAVIFGTPTRFGLPAAPLKQFIDEMGGLWTEGKLADKVASSFVSVATPHGGHETTILALNNTFYHWGGIIVAPGYLDPIQFEAGNPYGASHTSDNAQTPPDSTALESARFLGKRVTDVATKLRVAERAVVGAV